MTRAVAMAGVAGALAVVASWEALAALEQEAVVRALGRAAAPLRAAFRSGAEPSEPERRRLVLVGAGSLFAGGWLVAGLVAGLALATVGPWAVRRLLATRRRRWRAQLASAAPAVARAVADALAAGHSIRGAIALAATAARGAARVELERASSVLTLGEPTDVVLERLRSRARSPAWDTVVAAVLLQREAGGDLARLLRAVAAAAEEAARAEADARGATAQARFTAWLVGLMPVGAAILAELAQPGYLASLVRSPPSAWLLGGAAALQLMGIGAIRRVTRLGDA
jgi:tight adherence protein B